MDKNVYMENIFGSFAPDLINSQYKKCNYTEREIRKLSKITHFTIQEIKTLYKEFKARSSQKCESKNSLNTVQLLSLFGMASGANYYFTQKFVELFTIQRNKSTTVDIGFEEFLLILSKWCRGEPVERISMFFAMYDDGHKGYVSKKDIIKFLYSLAMYFLEVEYAWLDINSDSFKSRTIVAHHSISEIIDCLYSNLELISTEAISNFHEPDGEELLWCNEFKQWFMSIPGIAELICPSIQ